MTFQKLFRFTMLCALCCFSLSVFSQEELKSKIIDFGTLMPIESASIYVQNTAIGTVSNADGKFAIRIPLEYVKDTLIISSIGYKSFKIPVNEFDNSQDVYLEDDVATLDEVVLVVETRPKTGNDIVLRALKRLPDNMPEHPYLQKGFLRHKERNKKEFKWLIESAITVYDSAAQSNSAKHLKVNVDQVRKSYDLRDVDSLLAYTSYLKSFSKNSKLNARNLRRDTIATKSLVKAIKWNDTRVNGLEQLFSGKLNVLRNLTKRKALFGDRILDQHQFKLDTILVDNGRKIYKIKIDKSFDYVNLETPGIYNEGYYPRGWLYIYYDTYAIKKIEYELVAASSEQKSRSKVLFDTEVNHKFIMTYREYNEKMYPNYVYYETPKLVSVGNRAVVKANEASSYDPSERYYFTIQEVLFSDIINDEVKVQEALSGTWDPDIFAIKPYDRSFWRNYNTLLESEEDEKLIQDLTKRSSLYKD